MDLGICPRCGKEWEKGSEICSECGFVPIGAGLKSLPKVERKAKARPSFYNPGSTAGFLLSLVVLLIFSVSAECEPWKNDWESLRVFFGDEPSRSVAGHWVIVKAEMLDDQGIPDLGPDGLAGTLSFADSKAQLSLSRGSTVLVASGNYSMHGSTLILRNMKASEGGPGAIPDTVRMDLNWGSDHGIEAQVENSEILFLVRERGPDPK